MNTSPEYELNSFYHNTYNGQLSISNQPVVAKSFGRLIAHGVITVILIALCCWLLVHNWQLRQIRYDHFAYTDEEARKLNNFPDAQYAYGMRAWSRGNVREASKFFTRVVSEDPFYMDAWLRLAEVKAKSGHTDEAQRILMFVNNLTSGVYRWQWPLMLLARDLGIDEIMVKNANDLLGHRRLNDDTLRLLDLHRYGDTAAVADDLESENLVPYMKWLIRWGRMEDSGIVWQRIVKEGEPDQDLVLQYTHFLVEKKKIMAARDIWYKFNGIAGITNAGFERAITQRGFDWRYTNDKKGNWEINRVNSDSSDGFRALQIWFSGSENISFYHLYQIVPVVPLEPYRLSYRWKSERITTDQGPFIEIYGYDQNGLYHKGPMITGTHLWQAETLEFTPPEQCHAVVVRLRRLKSRRFDSKIAGTLWLDDFKLQKLISSRLNAESSRLKAR